MAYRRCPLAAFLIAVEGNWRNAVWIESCQERICGRPFPCSGHLFTCDAEGMPILLPVDQFCQMTGEIVDPFECSGKIERSLFELIYLRRLLWTASERRTCGVEQLASTPPCVLHFTCGR